MKMTVALSEPPLTVCWYRQAPWLSLTDFIFWMHRRCRRLLKQQDTHTHTHSNSPISERNLGYSAQAVWAHPVGMHFLKCFSPTVASVQGWFRFKAPGLISPFTHTHSPVCEGGVFLASPPCRVVKLLMTLVSPFPHLQLSGTHAQTRPPRTHYTTANGSPRRLRKKNAIPPRTGRQNLRSACH